MGAGEEGFAECRQRFVTLALALTSAASGTSWSVPAVTSTQTAVEIKVL